MKAERRPFRASFEASGVSGGACGGPVIRVQGLSVGEGRHGDGGRGLDASPGLRGEAGGEFGVCGEMS